MDQEPKKFIINWSKFGQLTDKLAVSVLSAYKDQVDAVIGIARGGVPISMIIADRLEVELDFMRIKSYKGIGIKAKPKIVSDVYIDLRNKKVLVVDDLVDQGDTFKFAIEFLNKMHSPKKINTAALFIKPWSKFKPDVYIESIDKWVVFPWELKEFNILENTGLI